MHKCGGMAASPVYAAPLTNVVRELHDEKITIFQTLANKNPSC